MTQPRLHTLVVIRTCGDCPYCRPTRAGSAFDRCTHPGAEWRDRELIDGRYPPPDDCPIRRSRVVLEVSPC